MGLLRHANYEYRGGCRYGCSDSSFYPTMPSAQDDAIARLDSILAIPKDVITSQAVQSKKTEVLLHLYASDANTPAPSRKRARKPDAKADDKVDKPVLKASMLVKKLQGAFIEIKTFFEDDFYSNVLKEVIASNSDPLLVIVRAGHDTRAQTAAYGYGAEVFYNEVNEILHREAPHQPTLTINKYLKAHGNDRHIATRAYYMGRKIAKLDSTQVDLAQVAIQAKDHFERLLNDAIPLFWMAFQQHNQLKSLLTSVDFGVVRKAFREALSKSRMKYIKFSSSVIKISKMDFGSILRESIDLRSRGNQAGSDHLIQVTLSSLPSALSPSQLY